MRISHSFVVFVILVCSATIAQAQVVHQDLKETVPAEVISILSEEERDIIGTDATALVQEIEAEIQGGLRKGSTTIFLNDLVELKEGDAIYVNRIVEINGTEYFEFKDVNRTMHLVLLIALFFALLVWFAGKQGARAFTSLAGSVIVILFVLVPLLLKGYPPVLTSVAVASVVLALALFVTHGVNARSLIAFSGTVGAVLLTGIIATLFVHAMRLTGLSSDASIYLNFGTERQLDFAGLLLGSIIIGMLGVLDDVSITQASVVRELKAANNSLKARELYLRAIRVGRDHIGSLVNTLALAYIGAALPLVLLFSQAGSDFVLSINQEIVSSELVRIFAGSIGLILAVPLTTLIAGWWFGSRGVDGDSLVQYTHSHHH